MVQLRVIDEGAVVVYWSFCLCRCISVSMGIKFFFRLCSQLVLAEEYHKRPSLDPGAANHGLKNVESLWWDLQIELVMIDPIC